MKQRTILELLIILRDHIEKFEYFDDGMCWEISRLFSCSKIEVIEHDKLLDYLIINSPGKGIRHHWWKSGLKNPRINWLNERIKIERKKMNFKI